MEVFRYVFAIAIKETGGALEICSCNAQMVRKV